MSSSSVLPEVRPNHLCSTPDLTASLSVSSSTPRSVSSNLPRSSSLSLEPTIPAPPRDLSPCSRRQLRYHRAQALLSASLQHSSAEPTLVEQQVRALERATAILSTQAKQAKEQAARLRECLADRASVEPSEFEVMLRERWLADKREAEMADKVRALEASLATLREGGQCHAATEPRGDMAGAPRTPPRQKAKTNLALFLEHMGTRVPLASRLAPGQHVVVAAQRRKTMHRVRSLRLRQSACTFAFQLGMARPSARPPSPAGSLIDDGASSASSVPGSPSLSPRTPPPPSTPSKGVAAPTSPRSPRTPPKPSSRLAALPPSTSSAPASPWPDGFADILHPGSPRSRADLLAQIEADDPGVPAYAVDLLDALVSSELDVSLRAPTHAHAPAPHTPPRARHESESFGTAAARILADGPRAPSPSPTPSRDRSSSATSIPSWMAAHPPATPSKASAAQKFRHSLHLGGLGTSKSNPNLKAAANSHAHAHAHVGTLGRLNAGSPLRNPLTQTSSSLASVLESFASSEDEEEHEHGHEHGRARRSESRGPDTGLDSAESRSFSVVSFNVKGGEPQGVGGIVARMRHRLSGLGRKG